MDRKKIVRLSGADIFQRENQILSNVELEVEEGEFIYVIGKVGTGKTSLIKTLNGELPLVKGEGEVLGYDLARIKKREVWQLRRKLGVVFQDFRLLTDRNVYENLAFVLKATQWKGHQAIRQRVEEVLKTVGMEDKIEKMPHELSGGEQQHIVIARAILNDPELLLVDEPTGNLDPETSDQILDIFIQLNKKGKTVLIATHDYAVIARKTARTLVCSKGQLTDSAKNTSEIEFGDLLESNI